MPSAFQRLIDGMRRSREGVLPSSQAFPAIDENQLVSELRLDERASEDGRANEPAADATAPSLAELDIRAAIERAARKAHEDYLSQRDLYETRLRLAVTSGEELVQIEAAGQSAIADYAAAVVEDRNHLHTLSKEVEDAEQEFHAFRSQHGLRRHPKLVSAQARLLHSLGLGIIVAIESVINGFFFAKGSSGGIIGGVLQAVVLSVLNVSVAAVYATYGMPRLIYRDIAWRVVGGIASLGYVGYVVALNIAIGHFRDLYISSAGNVSLQVLVSRVSRTPLLLDDAASLILVLLGILFGFLSVIDVASMRDRYPGFSAIGQAREDAIRKFAEEKSISLDELRSRRDQAIEQMMAAIELIRVRRHDAGLAANGRARLQANYLAYLDSLSGAYERLVRRHREANRKARTTTSPTYFQTAPSRLTYPDATPLQPLPEIEAESQDEATTRIKHYIELVNATFQEALPEYDTPRQLRALDWAANATT
jgi:hypothetical protein